jgi:hypothetical protein
MRNRVEKLRHEKTLFTLPNLSLEEISGLIPAYLSFTYSSSSAKSSIGRALLSKFDDNFLWGGFSDRENGYLVLSVPKMAEVQRFLDWANEQPGIMSCRIDIPTELISFPEKFSELLQLQATPREQ